MFGAMLVCGRMGCSLVPRVGLAAATLPAPHMLVGVVEENHSQDNVIRN